MSRSTIEFSDTSEDWSQFFQAQKPLFMMHYLNLVEQNKINYPMLDVEQENILSALDEAYESDQSDLFARGIVSLTNYLDTRNLNALSEEKLELARQGARLLEDEELLIRTLVESTAASIRQGNLPQADVYLQECFSHLNDESATFLWAEALRIRGLFKFFTLQYDQAIEDWQRCVTLYEELDIKWHLATTHLNLGNLYQSQAKFDEGYAHLEEGRRVASQINGQKLVMTASFTMATILLKKGNNVKSEKLFLETVNLSQKLGYDELLAGSLTNLAEVSLLENKPDQAEAFAREGLRVSKKIGQQTFAAAACINLAQVKLLRGESEETIHFLKLAEDEIVESGDHALLSHINWVKGEHYLSIDLCEQAKISYEAGLSYSRQINATDTIAGCLHGLSKVHYQLGEHDLAITLAQESLATIRTIESITTSSIREWLSFLENEAE